MVLNTVRDACASPELHPQVTADAPLKSLRLFIRIKLGHSDPYATPAGGRFGY